MCMCTHFGSFFNCLQGDVREVMKHDMRNKSAVHDVFYTWLFLLKARNKHLNGVYYGNLFSFFCYFSLSLHIWLI